jgi:hypothetical protein
MQDEPCPHCGRTYGTIEDMIDLAHSGSARIEADGIDAIIKPHLDEIARCNVSLDTLKAVDPDTVLNPLRSHYTPERRASDTVSSLEETIEHHEQRIEALKLAAAEFDETWRIVEVSLEYMDAFIEAWIEKMERSGRIAMLEER